MKRENKRKRKRGRISIRLMTTVHHLLSTFQTEFGTNSFFLIQRISLTKCTVSQTNQTNKEINRSTRKGRKKKLKERQMKMESNPIFTFLPPLLLVKSEQRASHTFWEWKEGEKSRVGVWRKREREREGLVKNHSAGVCLSVLLSACLMHVCIHCAHDTVCMRVCFPLLLFFSQFYRMTTEMANLYTISTHMNLSLFQTHSLMLCMLGCFIQGSISISASTTALLTLQTLRLLTVA